MSGNGSRFRHPRSLLIALLAVMIQLTCAGHPAPPPNAHFVLRVITGTRGGGFVRFAESLRAIAILQAPATPIPLHEGAARYYREQELMR